MAVRDGYCTPEDLLINGTKLPSVVSVEGAIAAAADEIDSEIGQLYETPIYVDPNDVDKRNDYLILKSINAALASGRLITSQATGGEGDRIHAYGVYLINFAYTRIKKITNGAIELTSAVKRPQPEEDLSRKGPRISNGDKYSLVDNFYQNFEPLGPQPAHWRQPTTEVSWPGY